MNKGLKNFQVDKFFQNQGNEEIMKNYMGVCSMESITRYINFYEIIKPKNGKCPFPIFDTDKHNQSGTNRWNFMDIHPKKTYFYLMD